MKIQGTVDTTARPTVISASSYRSNVGWTTCPWQRLPVCGVSHARPNAGIWPVGSGGTVEHGG